MATKYTRESEVQKEIEARRTPWIRQGPLIHPLSRRQRFFILFAGILVIILLVQIAVRLNQSAPFAYQSILRGEATVQAVEAVETDDGDSAAPGVVTLVVTLDDGRSLTGTWTMPSPFWEALAPGDRVALLYQVDKMRRSIRILECGVVALPDQMG